MPSLSVVRPEHAARRVTCVLAEGEIQVTAPTNIVDKPVRRIESDKAAGS